MSEKLIKESRKVFMHMASLFYEMKINTLKEIRLDEVDVLMEDDAFMEGIYKESIKNAGVTVKACSHITGGGFYENVPRMLIDGVKAVVKKDSYPIPPIFTKLAKEGNVDEHAMYNTYNMGIGMIVAVDPADVDKTMEAIKATGDKPYVIGHIEAGEKGVTLC